MLFSLVPAGRFRLFEMLKLPLSASRQQQQHLVVLHPGDRLSDCRLPDLIAGGDGGRILGLPPELLHL